MAGTNLKNNTNPHMKDKVNKEEWVAMFQEIGLDHVQMERWHKVFEARYPDAHQGFLEWLGLAPADIDQIRSKSR
jgi:hypothetical protein